MLILFLFHFFGTMVEKSETSLKVHFFNRLCFFVSFVSLFHFFRTKQKNGNRKILKVLVTLLDFAENM